MKLAEDNRKAIAKAVKEGRDYLMILKKDENGKSKKRTKKREQYQSNPE